MLQNIRDNSQGIIAKIIIGLIIAVFALFGVGSIVDGFVTAPPFAEVNGEPISDAQLRANVQRLASNFGGNASDFDQDFLERMAYDRLVEEVLLNQLAESGKLTVSDAVIDRAIVDTPQFQLDGRFDSELAVRTMTSQGFSVPLYRETVREQLRNRQLISAYAYSTFVTERELREFAALSRQTRDFRYVTIPLGNRTADTPVSDEAIEDYYNDNPAEFTDEETVTVQYVTLDKDAIAEEVAIDEQQLLALYEEERAEFEDAVEKRASHILFEVGADMTEEEALAAAAAARERLEAGEDFAALALELSSDTVSAEQGGDIGYTDGSAFPDAVEATLADLALDEVSAPVLSEFGVHLVKLTEDNDNVYEPFEEVRERIEDEAKEAEVDLIYSERLTDLSNLAFETAELDSLAEELGLALEVSEPFGRFGGFGVFANREVYEAAWSDSVFLDGNNSDVLEVSDNQSVVLRLLEHTPPELRTLDDARPEITVALRLEMEREAVNELGERLLDTLEQGEDIGDILAEEELEWVTVTAAERDSSEASREILNAVFEIERLNQAGVAYGSASLADDSFVLIELQAITPGDFDALDEDERQRMTDTMRSTLGNDDFGSVLEQLRAVADIRGGLSDEDELP